MLRFRYSWPSRSPYSLVGYRLRHAAGGLVECPYDGAPGEFDLEVVVTETFRAVQQDIRRLGKGACVRGLAAQGRFGRGAAPWLVGDTANRKASLLDRAAIKLQSGRHRHQRERIGQAVADLQIRIVRRKSLGR